MNDKRGAVSSQVQETRKFLQVCKTVLAVAVKVRPWSVAGYLVGAVLETAASILAIFASAKLAALLAQFIATGKADNIWYWLWIGVAAGVGSAIGFWIMRYSERLLYFGINKWAVDVFLSALNRIDIAGYYDDEMRNNINKANNGYSWQIPNMAYTVLELIYGIIRFLAIAALVAQIGVWLVFVIAAFLIPTLLSDGRIAKISWLVWDDKGDNRHIFGGLTRILSLPQSQIEVRSMQARPYIMRRINLINDTFYGEQERKYRKTAKLSFSAKLLEAGGVAIGSVVLLRQFLGHVISLERYFFLSGALLRVGGALNAIFGTLSRMQDAIQFADNFFTVIKTQPQIVDKPEAIKLAASKAPQIEFKNITFTYPGQTKPVFKDLSFTIKAGEHIALVGENGAGKTTIIKLLMRFYLPDSGEILINGQNLSDLSIESWYSQLASLFQTFNMYPLPINENIYIGRPDQKDDEARLEQAADFSGLSKLVKKYEHGWETVLDASFEKGIEPSGGQWQRVALGRAFYRQAEFLILDEPTSAIDAKAEYDIFNNIFDHYNDKTVLIVSHRFSTVRRANRIIVLEKGEIIEEGSHAKLMKNKGLYYDMFSKQAEGYK